MLGKAHEIAVDATMSFATKVVKGEEVTAKGIAADVAASKVLGPVGEKIGKKLAANSNVVTDKVKGRAKFPGSQRDQARLKVGQKMDQKRAENYGAAGGALSSELGSKALGAAEDLK